LSKKIEALKIFKKKKGCFEMRKVVFVFMLCVVNLLSIIVFNCLAQENILQDWIAGDGHVHTGFSSWDWSYGLGSLIGPTVSEQVKAGTKYDLGWMIFTDHEEMFYGNSFLHLAFGAISPDAFSKGLSRWLEEKQLCAEAEQSYGIPVMLGEEVGSAIPDNYTIFGSRGHYLAYNIGSYVFLSSYVLLRNFNL